MIRRMGTDTMVTETGGQQVISANASPTRPQLPARRKLESEEVRKGLVRQVERMPDPWTLKDGAKEDGRQISPS